MAGITVLPSPNDPRWRAVATGKISRSWQTLPMKLIMARVSASIARDPSQQNIEKRVIELREFFSRNMKVAQSDLVAIFE